MQKGLRDFGKSVFRAKIIHEVSEQKKWRINVF